MWRIYRALLLWMAHALARLHSRARSYLLAIALSHACAFSGRGRRGRGEKRGTGRRRDRQQRLWEVWSERRLRGTRAWHAMQRALSHACAVRGNVDADVGRRGGLKEYLDGGMKTPRRNERPEEAGVEVGAPRRAAASIRGSWRCGDRRGPLARYDRPWQ